MIAGLSLPGLVRLAREAQAPAKLPHPIVVSGVLARELAGALAAGGPAGLVTTGDPPAASALIRVLGGEPTPTDLRLLRAARRRGLPLVVVQTGAVSAAIPYVPATELIDVDPGTAFPVDRIAAAVVSVVGDAAVPLAAALPVFRDPVRRAVIRRASFKAAAVAALPGSGGPDLPLIVTAQARMLGELRRLSAAPSRESGTDMSLERIAPELAAPVAAGLVARTLVRRLGATRPVRAAVAAAVSLALGVVAGRLPAR